MNIRTLSHNFQQLFELIYDIQYGCVFNLMVRDREPVLDPPPRIVRDLMMGKRQIKRPLKSHEDFELKAQQEELVEFIRELRNGTIFRIEAQAGLPFRIRVSATG